MSFSSSFFHLLNEVEFTTWKHQDLISVIAVCGFRKCEFESVHPNTCAH